VAGKVFPSCYFGYFGCHVLSRIKLSSTIPKHVALWTALPRRASPLIWRERRELPVERSLHRHFFERDNDVSCLTERDTVHGTHNDVMPEFLFLFAYKRYTSVRSGPEGERGGDGGRRRSRSWPSRAVISPRAFPSP